MTHDPTHLSSSDAAVTSPLPHSTLGLDQPPQSQKHPTSSSSTSSSDRWYLHYTFTIVVVSTMTMVISIMYLFKKFVIEFLGQWDSGEWDLRSSTFSLFLCFVGLFASGFFLVQLHSMVEDGYKINVYRHIRTLLLTKKTSIQYWFSRILALALVLTSTGVVGGEGWIQNSTIVNLSGIGNVILCFLKVFSDGDHIKLKLKNRGDIIIELGTEEKDKGSKSELNGSPISRSNAAGRLSLAQRRALTILSLILGCISGIGGWANNPTIVNACAVFAVVVPAVTSFEGAKKKDEDRNIV
ncbi:hypothetical protein D9757_010712 [Collybiopsis confluens]|uniref:Transmembrane protein n=1 Tax=Collybiopsis confluens TaxID=2823264 RepID=A0A8H5GZY9_9AGAR|nr:hypothetical protein D9757_010712 [Collybiopsis confluens]